MNRDIKLKDQQEETPKRVYRTPELKRVGTITEMTRNTTFSTVDDNGVGAVKSGP